MGDECYDGLDEYDLEYQGYNTHQHDNRPYEVITEKKTVSYLDSKEDKKPDVKSNCTTKTATLKDGPKDPEMKLSTETEEGVTTKKSKLHSLFGDDKPVPKKDTKKAEEKKPSPQESKPKEPEVNPRESVKNQTLNQNTTSIQSSTNSFHEENDNRNAKTSVNYQGNKSYSKGNKFDKNTQQANNYYNNPNPMMYAQSNQYVPNYSMNNQYPNFPMGGMSSYSNMQMNPNFNMNMQPNMYQAYNLMQMQNMNPTMQQDSRVGPQGDSRYNVNNSNKSQRR